MQAQLVARFGFRIRTRQGLIVDPVVIPGRDASEAERKVRQIYRDCEILARAPSPGADDAPVLGRNLEAR